MKQFLFKLLDVSRSLLGVLMEFTRGLIAFLRSVNIDQPRGVILCVTLQLVVVISLVLAFRNPAGNLAQPLEGQVQPLTPPEVTESVEPDMPRQPASPSENP
jgi:hypothetical protein